MAGKLAQVQQLPLAADVSDIYVKREKEIRDLATRTITANGLTIDLVARVAGIAHSEQLSRALAGKGTHVPTSVYAVLLDPMFDKLGVFPSGLAAMAKGEFKPKPELSDEEFRRRVEKYARQDEMGAVVLRRALGGGLAP